MNVIECLQETNVASGGANPIQNNEVGSIWLNSHDKGMRKKKSLSSESNQVLSAYVVHLYLYNASPLAGAKVKQRFDVCKFFRKEMGDSISFSYFCSQIKQLNIPL